MTSPQNASGSSRLGVVALAVAVIGMLGAVAASVFGGLHLGPLEVRSATGLTDGEQSLLLAVFVAMGSQVLWVGLGLWGAIQGIVAVLRRRGRTPGVAAIVIGFGTPLAAFLIWLVLVLATSPLG